MIKKKSMLFMNIRLKIVTNMSIDTCLSFIISKWLYVLFYCTLPKIFKCKFSHTISLL